MILKIAKYSDSIPPDIAKRYPHQGKAQGHCASRLALTLAFNQIDGAQEKLSSWPMLYPDNPTCAYGLEDYYLSLSHSRQIGAALIAPKEQCLGVGVDIEFCDRPMKEGANRYFQNELDQVQDNQLHLWCLKEAAFKSLFDEQRLWQKKFGRELLLKDIWVKNNRFGLMDNPQQSCGSLQHQIENIEGQKLFVAIAFRDLPTGL